MERIIAAGRPVMSWINLGEVFYIVRREVSDTEAREVVRDVRPRPQLDVDDALWGWQDLRTGAEP